MNNVKEFLANELRTKEARVQYAADLLSARLALQVKTLRMQQELTQEALGKLAGLYQSQVSAMEQISCSSWKVSTLQKLASAFDLALSVKFVSFGKFLDEAVQLDRNALEEPKFADDPAFKAPIDFSFRLLEMPDRFANWKSPSVVSGSAVEANYGFSQLAIHG